MFEKRLEGLGSEPHHLDAAFDPGLPHQQKLPSDSVHLTTKNVALGTLKILQI